MYSSKQAWLNGPGITQWSRRWTSSGVCKSYWETYLSSESTSSKYCSTAPELNPLIDEHIWAFACERMHHIQKCLHMVCSLNVVCCSGSVSPTHGFQVISETGHTARWKCREADFWHSSVTVKVVRTKCNSIFVSCFVLILNYGVYDGKTCCKISTEIVKFTELIL